jgi:type 1 fimbriae regulatory protein FimB/type 1 fimbriae regulatory protein FimE
MILVGYIHGLRVSELCKLEWGHVDLDARQLHIRRPQGGNTTVHSLRGDECRLLRQLKREASTVDVFTTERGDEFTTGGFAKLIERAGIAAGIPFKVHPHMLRHSAGFHAINNDVGIRDLQMFLGHKSINSTTHYAALASGRSKNIIEKL